MPLKHAGTVLGALAFAWPCLANNQVPDRIAALKRMSFEELMNVEVTSVSRSEESLRDAAAAVALVTNETLRRSGAGTIPDALRMVPGIHVGQQTSSSWAVSARGFSSISSEKLLVLTDTRSIYTPLFSGVFWDSQDYLVEDVERVEVIRGPGATLWGSNAVNGVINITTRSARDTHGAYLEAGVGTFDRLRVGARYGAETEGGLNFRVFGKYFDRNPTENSEPLMDDDWQLGHVGFRMDWDGSARDSFTLQGDLYQGEIGQLDPAFNIIGRPGPVPPLEVENSGGNVLARWRRQGDGSDLQLRAYYDYTHRNDPTFGDTLNTFDVDLQQRFRLARHEFIWGASYRLMADRSRDGEIFALVPQDTNDQLFSGFVQDQFALTDTLRLTVGTKLEHNDFSGFEWQPSVRMSWLADDSNSLWMAVSRAVRVPTRIERDILVEITPPGSNPAGYLLGSDDFQSERLIAYEAGYRWRPLTKLFLDLALFYNDYEDLGSLELLIDEAFVDPGTGRIIVPVENVNLTSGRTRGAELLVEWEPVQDWQLTASYSYIDMSLHPRGQDLNRGAWLDGATPRNLAGLRSFLTLAGNFEIDAQYRYLSRIRRLPNDPTGQGLDAYSELDLRLGWRFSDSWSVSLLGQNLLHESHAEFGNSGERGRLERAAYLKADWRL